MSLGVASAAWPMLALPALFVLLLGALAVPKGGGRRVGIAAVSIGVVFALAGFVRFTVDEAAPGIVEGGRRAMARQSVAHLRRLVFAQDILREQATWDPDGDGIGSAGTLDALVGAPMRGTAERRQLVMRFGEMREVPGARVAVVGGTVIALYLPAVGGGATSLQENIDDERAERRWVAYAWPLSAGPGDSFTLFVDEHERLLVSDNRAAGQGYLGTQRMPAPGAALAGGDFNAATPGAGGLGGDGGVWTAWKGKRPRAKLVGGD